MRPTDKSLPTSLAQQMNRASANASAEVSARRSAGYGQPGLHTDQTVLLPPQSPSQIPGTYASAAEAWDPITTPAHSSSTFMSGGIQEQACLLKGIAAIEACEGTEAPVNATATGAEHRTKIKWVFNKRNFCKLLRECFAYVEDLQSARWTIKTYMVENIKLDARNRDLKAHNRDLKASKRDLEARNRVQEVTMDILNDQCQAYREELMTLRSMRQLDAEMLRSNNHLISMLFDRLARRGS